MIRPLRLLIVEDNPDDAELMLRELRRAGFDPDWHRVEREADYRARLDASLDVILSDYVLPQFSGVQALAILREVALDVPFILVSGTVGEDTAVLAMKCGAADYLLKDRLARLGQAVTQALANAALQRERRAIVTALESAERRYRSLFENAAEGIFQSDSSGRLTAANPALARILGAASPRELISGVHDVAALLCDDPGRLAEFARSLQERRAVAAFESRGRRLDGGAIRVVSSVRRVPQDGGSWCDEGLVVDVTENRRTEEALQAAEEDLRQSQKMDAIGRLAGGIAHDFNNLLTVIIGGAELMTESLPPGDAAHSELDQIRAAVDKAAALTRQLLAFSRKQVLQPRHIDLDEVVVQMEPMLRRLLPEHIDLAVAGSAGGAVVLADQGQIEQVVVNLAVNARDAMPDGGRLAIAVGNAAFADGGESAAGLPPGDYVELTVTDNGTGIDPGVRARMFEPFFTTKELGRGTGLGLASVYGIVKQSGGGVTVASELGRGSTLRVFLPRVRSGPREEPGPTPRVETGPPTGHETILIVEDEPAVRGVVGRMLHAAGYDVLTAATGGEALAVCAATDRVIHLVVTDVVMPMMGGRELAAKLRARYPSIRILFASGYSDDERVGQLAREAGTALIPKPFHLVELTREVRRLLDRPSGDRPPGKG